MPSSDQEVLDTYDHLLKVVHTFAGLFMWEYVITLDFEWEVYTGRRPWRWSFIVYLVARGLALSSIIVTLVGFNLTRQFNCEAWIRAVLFTSWFAAASASFLLVLRGVAIWGRDNRIMIATGCAFAANLVGSVYAVTKGSAAWSLPLHSCAISGTSGYKWSITINFVQDFILLTIMFFGVLHKKNATHLWNLLYFQGLFWILSAILTELPSVALSFKNINDPWNLMFQVPHMTFMVITSSRAYRDLFQYITSDQDSYPSRRRRRRAPRMRSGGAGGAAARDVQVTVTKTIEFDVELHGGAVHDASREEDAVAEGEEDEELDKAEAALEEAEEQVRTLELQMKQELQI
ncbi:hypothetical protein BC834DRAFT_875279 [Gloeopeniophorella convolvens]|nr:hypothetical protein BC834DRAFT_875279 [Gloeopeniophorella convolvens]